MHGAVAKLLGMDEETVAALAVGQPKTVRWGVAQMIRPMEAIVRDPPPPPDSWRCLQSRPPSDEGGFSTLVVAGDFMTQSSFLGCVASANAAASEVYRAAHQKRKEKRKKRRVAEANYGEGGEGSEGY